MIITEIFKPYKTVEDAIKNISDEIRNNFEFLNLQKQTGLHEVDIKRSETRLCIAIGCSISAIVMVGVTLEEFLKTLLKYKFIRDNRNIEIEPDLSEMKRLSVGAENKYGFFKLHNAIEKARKEKIITEGEKDKLLLITKYIRNAFVHSDKSKIFDPENKTNVFQVGFKDNDFQIEDEKSMSILELLPVQGIAQKKLANENAKSVFLEVDSLILEISERFWDNQNCEE